MISITEAEKELAEAEKRTAIAKKKMEASKKLRDDAAENVRQCVLEEVEQHGNRDR